VEDCANQGKNQEKIASLEDLARILSDCDTQQGDIRLEEASKGPSGGFYIRFTPRFPFIIIGSWFKGGQKQRRGERTGST